MIRRSGVSDSTWVTTASWVSVPIVSTKPVVGDREPELVGSVVAARHLEAVAVEDVEDRNLALVVDACAGARDAAFIQVLSR